MKHDEANTAARTILLVEDDVLIAMAEKMLLQKGGFSVIIANSGEKAVEIALQNDEIDLVLMDIDLGSGIDGTIAAEMILKERNLPLVFLSSHTEPETVAKTEKITSYGYVVKNTGETVLLASIRMAFRLHESRKAKDDLAESDKRHRVLFETISQGIVHQAADGSIVSANPAAERILGLTFDQMRGKTSMDPNWHMIREDGSTVDGNDHPAMIALRTGKTVGPVVRAVYHPDKKQHVWLRITAVPLMDSVYATFEDITGESNIGGFAAENTDSISQQKYLDAILETTADGFWVVDGAGQIIRTNAAYCRMTGFSAEELTGLSIKDIDVIEDPSETAARLQRLRTRGSETFETRHRRKDGTIFDVEVTASFIDSEEGLFVGFCRDVSEKKALELSLRENQEMSRALFDHALSAVYIADTTGVLMDVNHRALAISGYSREELLKMTVFDLSPDGNNPAVRETLLSRWEQWVSGESHLVEAVHRRKDGTLYPVLLSTGVIEYGNQRAITAVALDITERERAAEKIRKLVVEKETLLKELQHRIKNNINTMASLLSLQVDAQQNPEVTAALEDARGRVASMGVLYEQLYRGESTGSASLKDYVERLVKRVIQLFPRGERVNVRMEAGDCLCTNRQLSSVGLIINEVVTNAIKYAFPDHPSPELTITIACQDSRVIISLSDNGPGIPETPGQLENSGLGMMIISALTGQLDGSVRFERNNGTTVVLEFPVEQ